MALLADASGLLAYLVPDEEDHAAVREVAKQVEGPLISTCIVFGETMHLIRRLAGTAGQWRLWELMIRGDLELADVAWDRARDLMVKYADLPMDLGDATLVALGERRGLRDVLTLDGAFEVYRMRRGRRHVSFNILPA